MLTDLESQVWDILSGPYAWWGDQPLTGIIQEYCQDCPNLSAEDIAYQIRQDMQKEADRRAERTDYSWM